MLKRLSEWLALTTSERNVILFLVGTFLLGLGIRFYQETFLPQPEFDYRISDSTFAALSSSSEIDEETDESAGEAKVDINSASKTELMKLPGIGEVLAARILAYRNSSGPFRSVLDLKKVKGISAKKYEQIKNLIAVKEMP
ncbi:MAG: helix-hairpin-helix domain-containing protein [Ignavibacteriales bacterium]|nr:helix-hairpin-helix domain-containing protein [Ignavibacteriales bacterium]